MTSKYREEVCDGAGDGAKPVSIFEPLVLESYFMRLEASSADVWFVP